MARMSYLDKMARLEDLIGRIYNLSYGLRRLKKMGYVLEIGENDLRAGGGYNIHFKCLRGGWINKIYVNTRGDKDSFYACEAFLEGIITGTDGFGYYEEKFRDEYERSREKK